VAPPDRIAGRPVLLADTDRLTLVRTVFAENEPARVQVVAYRVSDGVLTRRESNATRDLAQLDMLWQAAISDGDTTPPVMLQAGVDGMQLQTWEVNGWRQRQAAPGEFALPQAATGLQVALQVSGQEASMSKAFLLGGL
jgi:general secretion pathway protein J